MSCTILRANIRTSVETLEQARDGMDAISLPLCRYDGLRPHFNSMTSSRENYKSAGKILPDRVSRVTGGTRDQHHALL